MWEILAIPLPSSLGLLFFVASLRVIVVIFGLYVATRNVSMYSDRRICCESQQTSFDGRLCESESG